MCSRYPFVEYVTGPHRGLCANRNAVVRLVDQGYLSLIDDDGSVGEDFILTLRFLLASLKGKVILTGDVLEYGGRTVPHNPSFWGHFTAKPRGQFKTLALNCNCFPASAFRIASFDESLVYGYEDMDLCSHLLTKGYRIQYEPTLLNSHEPPPRDEYANKSRYRHSQRARFQTSLKRYVLWEHNYVKAAVYCIAAPIHRMLHAVKVGKWSDIPASISDMVAAFIATLHVRQRSRVNIDSI